MQKSWGHPDEEVLSRTSTSSPAIILPNASYYGTLAAVRSLGRQGIEVLTADPSRLPLARYSRFTARHLHCPSFEDTRSWADWLLQIGTKAQRRVVYATSDAVSFALALHQPRLSERYHLYQPDLPVILDILDKGRLLQRARQIGVKTPVTWFPKSAAEAAEIAAEVGGQLLVKPRSQLSQRVLSKGRAVDADPRLIRDVFAQYLSDSTYGSEFGELNPDGLTPMIQRFHPEAMKGVYSLTGFRDRRGQIVLQAAQKTLQRPRRIGVGVCFEPVEVEPEAAEIAKKLSGHIGYYGAFEIEFIRSDEGWMVIDFNGRFYNQMGLDIARGLDLPKLAYRYAVGDGRECPDLLRKATLARCDNVVFRNGIELALMVGMQRICGSISGDEGRRWRRWPTDKGKRVVDAVGDDGDRLPSLIDVLQHAIGIARHPRAFVKHYGLNQ